MPQLGEIKRELKTSKAGKEKRRYHIWVKCPECNKEHWADYYHIKSGNPKRPGLCFPCSSYCQQGEKSHQWKGGRQKTTRGYITVRIARNDFFYPMVAKGGRVFEHRLMVAKSLNRCLLPWEIVHHKNGIKDDNKIENLQLLPDKRWHLVDTQTKAMIKQLQEENAYLREEIAKLRDIAEENLREVIN